MDIILAIPVMAWLIISAVLFAIGEFLSKKFALNPSWEYVVVTVFVYLLGSLAWLPAILQKNQLSIWRNLGRVNFSRYDFDWSCYI